MQLEDKRSSCKLSRLDKTLPGFPKAAFPGGLKVRGRSMEKRYPGKVWPAQLWSSFTSWCPQELLWGFIQSWRCSECLSVVISAVRERKFLNEHRAKVIFIITVLKDTHKILMNLLDSSWKT